jgi:hypothetical protein
LGYIIQQGGCKIRCGLLQRGRAAFGYVDLCLVLAQPALVHRVEKLVDRDEPAAILIEFLRVSRWLRTSSVQLARRQHPPSPHTHLEHALQLKRVQFFARRLQQLLQLAHVHLPAPVLEKKS